MRLKVVLILLCGILFLAPVAGLEQGERVPLEFQEYSETDQFERVLELGTIQYGWTIEGYVHNDHDNYVLKLWLAELEEDDQSYSLSTIDLNNYKVNPGENLTFRYEEYLSYCGGEVALRISADAIDTGIDPPKEMNVMMDIAVYDAGGNIILTFEEVELHEYGSDGGFFTTFPSLPVTLFTFTLMIVGMAILRRDRKR